jgi:hypothetical protein
VCDEHEDACETVTFPQTATLAAATTAASIPVPPMWTLLIALISLSEPAADPTSHLRATSPFVRSLIDEATVSSAIVNRLITQLQQSDTIVYVELTGSPEVPRARTMLAAASGDVRFLRISMNVLVPPMDRVALLAHELQHATEIADAIEVRDEAGLRQLYDRIGFGGTTDRYETVAAGEVERRVRAEQFARRVRRGP